MYVGQKKDSSIKQQFFIAIFIILFLLVILSSLLDRSPTRMMADGWNYMTGNIEDGSWKTYAQLKNESKQKDTLIVELESSIEMMKKANDYKQAIVSVDSDNLNMRQKPQLGAKVILQLPIGSIVDILYYDDETLRLGGEYGKWCKIRYVGKEGWVWGNYLETIN